MSTFSNLTVINPSKLILIQTVNSKPSEFLLSQYFKEPKTSEEIENALIKLHLTNDFRDQILQIAPKKIFYKGGTIKKLGLTEQLRDTQILSEIGLQLFFSVPDFFGALKELMIKQPKGEAGILSTNFWGINIFYLLIPDGRIVVADTWWDFRYHLWQVSTRKFELEEGWEKSCFVFTP